MPAPGLDKAAAREVIHGMPAAEWKARFQTEATPEQLARMERKPEEERRHALTARGLIRAKFPQARALTEWRPARYQPANRFTRLPGASRWPKPPTTACAF
jgi:hypothetical protein